MEVTRVDTHFRETQLAPTQGNYTIGHHPKEITQLDTKLMELRTWTPN